MDNLEIGQWPLNISRVSLLLFVLLIHALILGAVMKIFYLGRGGGGGCGPLFFNQGYARKKKEEEAGGRRVGLRNRIATSMAVKVILALQ